MKQKTIDQLLELNKKFYQHNAGEFSQSRRSAWVGWNKILPYFTQLKSSEVHILDLGCGNGRFLSFLLKHLSKFSYLGIEANEQLLKEAKKIGFPKTSAANIADNIKISFKQADLLSLKPTDFIVAKSSVPTQSLVITLFGVLHHLPGSNNRTQLFQTLADIPAAQTRLIFTTWNFLTSPSQQHKISAASLSNSSDFSDSPDLSDLEPNDYLLTWSNSPHRRYCHYFSQTEVENLLSTTNWELVDQFAADGKEDNLNHYYIVQKRVK